MSDTVTIRHNLAQLNDTLVAYQRASNKTWPEVLAKQGGKLGYSLSRNLRGLAPARGEVRAEMLDRLRDGEGVRVRPSVMAEVLAKRKARTRLSDRAVVFGAGEGKSSTATKSGGRLNLTAMAVSREIAMRESARGFLGWSARYPRTLKKSDKAYSRYRRVLSSANIRVESDEKSVRFAWPGDNPQSAGAVQGLNRDQSRAAIASSLEEVRSDTQIYIDRKQQQALTHSFSLLNRVVLKAAR